MSYALVSGTLFRKPEEKISKGGKLYAVATIKSGFGENIEFWRVTAFSDAATSALLELDEGDSLSASGLLQVSVYAPEGKEPRANLALVADQIISARAAKNKVARERRKEASGDSRARRENAAQSPAGKPSDWRARQGRTRDEQAANGGLRHYGGEAHSELNDEIPW